MPDKPDLTLVVLKAHLLLEEIIERIVQTVVAHGDLLDTLKLGFFHKAVLAQAMSWTKHDSPVWDIVFAINSLRNELAHSLESPKLQQRIDRVVDASVNADITGSDYRDLDANIQVVLAAVYALGFLDSYEKDAQAYRKIVDQAIKTLTGQ